MTSATTKPLRLVAAALALLILTGAMLAWAAATEPSMTRKLFGLWRARDLFLALLMVAIAFGLLAAAKSRAAMFGYLSSCIAVVVMIGMLELVGQIGVISWPQVLTPQPKFDPIGWKRQPHLDVSGQAPQDLAARWGMGGAPIEYRFRADQRGFRNADDRDAADVYLLGDSIVVGALVPSEQTVSGQLEKTLRHPVMQVALLGRGPQEVQALFREASLPVQGRLVLQFVFEGNDLLDSRRFRTEGELDVAPAPPTARDRSFVQNLVLALQRWTQPVHGAARLRTCTIGDERFAFGWTRDAFAGHEDELVHIASSLESFDAEIRAAGGRFAVVVVPTKLRVLGPHCQFSDESDLRSVDDHLGPLPAYLRAWSTRSGIPVLDLTDALSAAMTHGEVPWLALDTHWNAAGHAVAAQTIATWDIVSPIAPGDSSAAPAQAPGLRR